MPVASVTSFGDTSLAQVFFHPEAQARRIAVPRAGVLFDGATPAEDVFFIESGQVRMHQIAPNGADRLADILGAGQWFGVSAIAGVPHYNVRPFVVVPSVFRALPVDRFLELVTHNPQAARELIRRMAQRLCDTYSAAAQLVFDDANRRLIETLMRFSHSAAASRQDDGNVVLNITHRQLADAVGAARETVSIALSELRRKHVLKTARNRVLFHPETLRSFVRRTLPVESAPETEAEPP